MARYTIIVSPKKGASDKNSLSIGGYETRPQTKLFTETFLATDETEKYTDICVILPHLGGVAAAGTENRMDKIHTLQLEGYRKFDFMRLRTQCHAAPSGECSYFLDARQYHHAQVMRDFTSFFNLQTTLSMEHIFLPVYVLV